MGRREDLVAQAAALAISSDDATAALEQLFADPGALASSHLLRPMLDGFVAAATAERAWSSLAPLARRWLATPTSAAPAAFGKPVVTHVLDAIARRPDRDPRWIELCLEAMATPGIYDETYAAVLEGQPLPAATVDAMLADAPPRPLLLALAQRDDRRCRAPLEAGLRAAQGPGGLVYVSALRQLSERDDDLLERTLAAALTTRRSFDGKLDGDLADAIVQALARGGPLRSAEHFEAAWHAVAQARVAAEEPEHDAAAKAALLARLDALRPERSSWHRAIVVRRAQDGEARDRLDEATLRQLLERDGTYEVTLGDGLLFVMLGATHGWLFVDVGGRYREARSAEPPDDDQELPGIEGAGTEPIPARACIARGRVCDLVVQACQANAIAAADVAWIELP